MGCRKKHYADSAELSENHKVPSQIKASLCGENLIFGYNTEIREGETVYHVQSEARGNDLLLETQVFVRGQCIAKRSISSPPQADKQIIQESLRQQHRDVLSCIRAGQLDLNINRTEPSTRNFDLACTGAFRDAGLLVLRFQLSEGGVPSTNVRLRCFLAEGGSVLAPELVAELVSNGQGIAELRIDDSRLSDAEVQIELEGEQHRNVRRFRLKHRQP